MTWILLAHAMATFFMVGLIWFVQLVHYPLLKRVGKRDFPQYEAAHCRLTTWVVGPPMLVEAATAPILFWYSPFAATTWMLRMGMALLLVIWLSTALLQVPRHRDLGLSFQSAAHRRLVATNWVRTVAWSLRGVIAVMVLAESMK